MNMAAGKIVFVLAVVAWAQAFPADYEDNQELPDADLLYTQQLADDFDPSSYVQQFEGAFPNPFGYAEQTEDDAQNEIPNPFLYTEQIEDAVQNEIPGLLPDADLIFDQQQQLADAAEDTVESVADQIEDPLQIAEPVLQEGATALTDVVDQAAVPAVYLSRVTRDTCKRDKHDNCKHKKCK